MKKFFESKQNKILVAVAAAVCILIVAVIVTVVITQKHKTYVPEPAVPPTETLTDAPTVFASEAESTEPESTESDTQTSLTKETTASNSKSDAPNKDKNKDKDKSKDKTGSSGSGNNTPVINLGSLLLEGRWGTAEYIEPSEVLEADFIARTGFRKQLCVCTEYQFNTNKTFSITYTVGSTSEYVNALREAYRIYLRDMYPEWTSELLESRAERSAWQIYWDICEAVIGVRDDQVGLSGKYSNDDTAIYYQCDGLSFSETYVIKDNTLTLTGSSEGNEGYPIVLHR